MLMGFDVIGLSAKVLGEAVWRATRNMDPETRKRLAAAAEFVVKNEWKIQLLGLVLAGLVAIFTNEFTRVLDSVKRGNLLLPPFTIAFAAITFGGALFLLRLKQRIIYSSSELLFAIITATYAAFELNSRPAESTFKLVASAYLVVRGLDNLKVGLEERGKTLTPQEILASASPS